MMRSSRRHTAPWRRLLPVTAALAAGVSASLMLYRTELPAPLPTAVLTDSSASTIAGLIHDVEAKRGLSYRQALSVKAVPASVISDRHLTHWKNDGAALRRRAWSALGFRWEPDWPAAEAIAGLQAEESGCYYDPVTHDFLYDERDAPVVRPSARAGLTRALALTLVQQWRGPAPLLGGENDDSAQARTSLARAEAECITTLCLLAVPPPPPDEQAPGPFYAAPKFLRELMAFPSQAGTMLAGRLQGFPAIEEAWRNAPQSTAAVLKPDSTAPPVPCPAPAVPGMNPLHRGVLGFYGIQTLLRTQLTRAEVQDGSAGWRGDAYTLFDGDNLIWDSRWESSARADSFASAMSRTLAMAAGLKETDVRRSGNTWSATAARSFHIYSSDQKVRIITAADPSFIPAALRSAGTSTGTVTRNP